MQVFVEARLVDRVEGTEAHRDRRVLPELRHQPGMRVRRQPRAADLAAEVVELFFGQSPLEEGTRVDPRSRVTLEVDVIAGETVLLAMEEPVEADLIERRARRVRRQVPADALG